MGLPAALRAGGQFIFGTVFEVFEKAEGFKDKNTGEWVRSKHWVVELKSQIVLRGRSREVSNLVYLSSDQVKAKVHEKFMSLENTFVCFPVFNGAFQRVMLQGDAVVNLSE
jgi:small nuclear ribonucleoprotein (snRNP)-like protein